MSCESNKVTTARNVGGNGCLPGSLYHTVFIEQEILEHFLSFTESLYLHRDAFNSVPCCLYLGLQVFNTFHTIVSTSLQYDFVKWLWPTTGCGYGAEAGVWVRFWGWAVQLLQVHVQSLPCTSASRSPKTKTGGGRYTKRQALLGCVWGGGHRRSQQIHTQTSCSPRVKGA